MPVIFNDTYVLQKMPGKGGWTYVVLPGIAKELRGPGHTVKVQGTIDEYELTSCNLFPMKTGGLFLPVKSGIRKQIGKEAGDVVKIVFSIDAPPADLREDLIACLEDEPAAYKTFLSYTEADQDLVVEWIRSARNEDTRTNRMAKAIDCLEMGLSSAKIVS